MAATISRTASPCEPDSLSSAVRESVSSPTSLSQPVVYPGANSCTVASAVEAAAKGLSAGTYSSQPQSRGVPDHGDAALKKSPSSTSGWMPVRQRRISLTIQAVAPDRTTKDVLEASPPIGSTVRESVGATAPALPARPPMEWPTSAPWRPAREPPVSTLSTSHRAAAGVAAASSPAASVITTYRGDASDPARRTSASMSSTGASAASVNRSCTVARSIVADLSANHRAAGSNWARWDAIVASSRVMPLVSRAWAWWGWSPPDPAGTPAPAPRECT